MPKWDKVSITVHDIFPDENIFTMAEFGEKLGVSLQTVNRWHNSGFLKSKVVVYNNRKYRYYTFEQYSDFVNSEKYENLSHVKNADLIGKTFGKLTVIDFSEKARKKGYYASYLCKCDCGNKLDLPRSSLLSGKHLSCGCKFHDLTGKTFGYWHVDSLAPCSYTPGGSKLFNYNCTCACGTKKVVIARSLTSGASQSCGCRRDEVSMSKYEFCIRQYLEELGLKFGKISGDNCYKVHETYSDLLGVGGHRLSYDFHVIYRGHEWLIECQGGQHYFAVDLWGGEEAFERQLEHDKRKRDYANLIGVDLIEVPYTCIKKDDIILFLHEQGFGRS